MIAAGELPLPEPMKTTQIDTATTLEGQVDSAPVSLDEGECLLALTGPNSTTPL